MASGRSNISRSAWRLFEILLFFAISVVGFTVYAKTSTLNSKLKSRVCLQRLNDSPEHCGQQHSLLHTPRLHPLPALAKQPHSATPATAAPFGCIETSFRQIAMLGCFSSLGKPVFTPLPRNLLQENPVLLT